MNDSFQTSFIPKKPISNSVIEKKPSNPFVTFSLVILFLAILATLGLFFYRIYLSNQKNNLAEALNKARASFEEETIKELEQFSSRIEMSKSILENHIVLSPMLAVLGEITIPTIQYTGFSHSTPKEKFFEVTMQGVAVDYKSIALQSEMFNSSKGRFFKNVIFSNLVRNNYGTTGNNYVTFDVTFEVDPYLLSFSQNPQSVTSSDNNDFGQPNENINRDLPSGTPSNININL